ncbi:trans-resveratrol di-O-methyltransferase-like [Aristolochia californica]|uniref:trans-resveratrol di-O-methyltransferase-like n=1 Tax=Aristolochia californica TaxID=171875 RepID=UPI0035D9BD69
MVLEEDGSSDPLKAQAHLWNHLFSFINPMSLKCAVELGIPDIMHNHGKPMSLSHLVSAIHIPVSKTDQLHRLLRLLVHTGMFSLSVEKHKDGETEKMEEFYALTPSSRLLVRDGTKECLSPFLLMMLDSSLINPWHFFSEWYKKEGTTSFKLCHGVTPWEHANRCPELNDKFNQAMSSDTQFLMSTLVAKCAHVFDGLNSLVDVGGGTGAAARALAEAFPDLEVTVLDLPHVVAHLPTDSGVYFTGGDMFQWIPQADAIFLKWILHDWSDDECIRILQKCKEAIPSEEKGGKVIILEMVVNSNKGDHKFTETQFFFDLMMCAHVNGKERGEDEWKKLFENAGFSHCKITPILGLRSVIEVFP